MLRDEIVPYTGTDGLVWSSLAGPGGNGVLYTAEYYVMLDRLNQLQMTDKANWLKVMAPCVIKPGLIQRSATDQEQEGPDDYVGYLTAACVLSLPWVDNDVYQYGLHDFGAFNNVTPGAFSWQSMLWRQPQLIAHIKYSMKKIPNFALRLTWIVSILLAGYNTDTKDTDTTILSWLLIQSWTIGGNSYGIFGRLAVKYWTYRLLKVYGPKGMQSVFGIYFQPDHPIAKYSVIV